MTALNPTNTNTYMSSEIRQLIVKYVVNDGLSIAEAARRVGRSEMSVRRVVNIFLTTNSYERGASGGARRIVINDDIRSRLNILMNDGNSYNLNELKQALDISVHISTLWRWLKDLNYTYKIIRPIPEMRNNMEVKSERKSYVEWYLNIPVTYRYRNFIYIDESPFNLHMIRNHGYSQRGTTPNQVVQVSRGPNVSMILAVSAQNIILSEAVVGGVNTYVFQRFLMSVKRILGEDEDFTLVMDNVRFHHSNSEFYDGFPYLIHYLPRYSPFLNPCEEVFSKIKIFVRGATAPAGRQDLLTRMQQGAEALTSNDLSNYFQHCESFFTRCTSLEDIPRE